MELVRKYKFATLFINQFYPRPGTPAAKMQRLPTSEVKRRSRELTHLFEEFRPFKGRVSSRKVFIIIVLAIIDHHRILTLSGSRTTTLLKYYFN